MEPLLVDTNILVDALNGRRDRLDQISNLLTKGALLGCTSINVTEVYMGMRAREAVATQQFLRALKFYPITWEIAALAGKLYHEWRGRGKTLSLPDVSMAAVCIANDLTLVTENRKHFPMPELRIHALI
jgi:predicted nucleic acid-binding protein